MTANSLSLFNVKKGSLLDRLDKSELLITQKEEGEGSGFVLSRLFSANKKNKKNPKAKQFKDTMNDLKKKLTVIIDPDIKAAVKKMIGGDNKTIKNDELRKRAGILLESLGGNAESLSSSQRPNQMIDPIAMILSIPTLNPEIQEEGFTTIEPGVNLNILKKEIIDNTNKIRNFISEPDDHKKLSQAFDNFGSAGPKQLLGPPEEALQEFEKPLVMVPSAGPVSQGASQASSRSATEQAQIDLAQGIPQAQGAGAAASIPSFMSSSSRRSMEEQEQAGAEGPEGGFTQKFGQGVGASFRFDDPNADPFMDPPPGMAPLGGLTPQFDIDVIGPAAEFTFVEPVTGVPYASSFGPQPGAFGPEGPPPGPDSTNFNNGPDQDELAQLAAEARFARLIAQQNGKLANDILGAMRKPGKQEFLSFQKMNSIISERETAAKALKEQSLYRDHINSGRQEAARKRDIQRLYNDQFRVALAPSSN